MRPFCTALLATLLCGSLAWAEDTPAASSAPTSVVAAVTGPVSVVDIWNKQVVTNLTLNQGSFNNWQQGGANFIAWQAGFNGKLEKDNPSLNWLNTLKLGYGLTYMDGQGTRITTDTIDLESVLALKTWPQVNPYVSFSAQNQFDAGYNYSANPAVQISAFMDPGYFTESAGLKYTPDPVFNTRLGVGVKETVASQFESIYTVDPSTGQPVNVLTEVGLSWVSELNCKLSTTSNLASKLDMFWNGNNLNQTVVEWDNLLSVGVSKIVSLTLENDYRWDNRVYNGWQIKETAGLSVAYNLL
jgi:hypothetical protein